MVADASVIAKWFVIEKDSEKALEIRGLHASGSIILSSPLLVVYELGNVLTKHPSFTGEDSGKAFQSFLDLDLELRSFTEQRLLRRTLEISRELGISFYDAVYVTLAKEDRVLLLTADRELHKKIKGHCDVRLLEEITPKQLV